MKNYKVSLRDKKRAIKKCSSKKNVFSLSHDERMKELRLFNQCMKRKFFNKKKGG